MRYTCFIPVSTFPDVTSRASVALGMAIAARLDARFHALIHEVDIAPVGNVLADLAVNVTAMSQRAEAGSKAAAEEFTVWLNERANTLHRPIVVETIRCRPEALIDHWIIPARTNDLTLMAAPQNQQEQALAMELIFANGGPVLLVPDDAAPGVNDAMNICIAWDGGRAAARAVRDAMPLLSAAGTVSIVVIEDDKHIEGNSAEALRHWLDHRGIETRLLIRSRGTVPIGQTLQAAALANGADMLVMGAYGHSRLRQLILGGATRSMFEHARLPIFTVH